MANFEIKLYEDKYKDDLADMLKNMSEELFGLGTVNLEAFIERHWAIYLAVVDGKAVGLSSYVFNDYFGLRLPTMGNSYLYLEPEWRNTRVSYFLGAQFGKVSEKTNLPIETYYASDTSRLLGKRMEGKFLYDVYEYSPEAVKAPYARCKKFGNLT